MLYDHLDLMSRLQAQPQPQLGAMAGMLGGPAQPRFGQSYQTPMQQAFGAAPAAPARNLGFPGAQPTSPIQATFGQSYQTPMQQRVAKQAQPPRQMNMPLFQAGLGMMSGQPMDTASMIPLVMQAFRGTK